MQYFQVWATAASAHDDERALKRLRTRQRFVNIAEEKMAQKQAHCEYRCPTMSRFNLLKLMGRLDDEVMRAFESALALLKAA